MANLARLPSLKVNAYATGLLSSGLGFPDALDDALRANFRYRSEEKEIVRTPEFMLNDLEQQGYAEGDCDDIATLACALCRASGIPSRLTAIASTHDNPNREFDHVFCECLSDSGYVPVDPTVARGTVYTIFSAYHEQVS